MRAAVVAVPAVSFCEIAKPSTVTASAVMFEVGTRLYCVRFVLSLYSDQEDDVKPRSLTWWIYSRQGERELRDELLSVYISCARFSLFCIKILLEWARIEPEAFFLYAKKDCFFTLHMQYIAPYNEFLHE